MREDEPTERDVEALTEVLRAEAPWTAFPEATARVVLASDRFAEAIAEAWDDGYNEAMAAVQAGRAES